MKFSDKLLKDDPYNLTPPPGSSGTSMSSKTPGRDLEDMEIPDEPGVGVR